MTIRNQEALNERANNLGAFNGIEMVLVELQPHPTEAVVTVHFFNSNQVSNIFDDVDQGSKQARDIFPVKGGHRIRGGSLPDQVQVVSVAFDPTENTVLRLTVKPIGDYSTYTLGVVYEKIDPIFGEIDFKFRPGCFDNCPPDWESPPAPKPEPAIDYLAKDYDSFRHALISWMINRVPGWEPTSEADLDQVLLELFSVAADELSDYQDRVMNEAYLATARKRVSLARHARLMDYHIHQGSQASTWLALRVKDDEGLVLPTGFLAWPGSDGGDLSSVAFMNREERPALLSVGLQFQAQLDSGNVSDALRNAFAAVGIALSPNASVSVKQAGSRWLLTDEDNNQLYLITRVENRLNVYRPHLHHWFDDISLYTWGDSIPALEAGTTSADLRLSAGGETQAKTVRNLIRDGTIAHLLIEERLNPLTGETRGRDPTRRQLLRLLPGDAGAEAADDPVTGEWFVRVHWQEEDKLKSTYCFTVDCRDGKVPDVSLFQGNLVRVYGGQPRSLVFKAPEMTLNPLLNELHYERTNEEEVICRLPDGPLAYTGTAPGGDTPPKSTLEVRVEVDGDMETWDEVISLVHSDASDERGDHFVVETDEEGRSLIRFGNGTNGKKLLEGAVVRCTYQVGRGLDGNVGADSLQDFDRDAFPEVDSCWNPFDVTDGRDPEPVAEIIRRVPEAYRYRQLRAVTLKDYVDRAEEFPGVSRASARYMWTGSWRTVRITIDPAGTPVLSPELREDVARYLEAVRLIGEDLEIRPPRFVPLDIVVSLCVTPDYWPEYVRSVLEQEFSDGYTPDGRKAFFHPDRWTFGQGLWASQILGRVQSVEGVDHVIGVSMKRWNEATPGTPDLIEVRPDEILQVRNDPDHMERGFIRFDPRGGRR